VNNAGVGSSVNLKPLVDFDDDFWDLSLQINLTVPYQLSKVVLAVRWGRIITIASINSCHESLHGAAYAASKYEVLGLMRFLAIELAKEGITVNAIYPGLVKTLMNDNCIEYDAA